MSFRTWQLRVQDILAAIASIEKRTKEMTFAEFSASETVAKSVLYDFLIIGEASTNIPQHIQSSYSHIPWRLMKDMRNVIAHEYFQVNLNLIWRTIQKDLPLLKSQLSDLSSVSEKTPGFRHGDENELTACPYTNHAFIVKY